MSDFQNSINGARTALNNINLPALPAVTLFNPDILDAACGEEKTLFGVAGVSVDLNKRSAKLIFKEPVFVDELRFHLAATIIPKDFRIELLGASEAGELSIASNRFTTANETLKVGLFLKGFEISCGKHIKSSINGIEAFGYPKTDFDRLVGAAKIHAPALVNIKSALGDRLSELEKTNQNLLQKQNQLSKIDTEIKEKTAAAEELDDRLSEAEVSLQEKKKEAENQKEILSATKKLESDLLEKIDEHKKESEGLKNSIKDEQKNLNALLEKKSFYNETLGGHKAETRKNITLNIVLMLGLISSLTYLLHYVMGFYHETVNQILTIKDGGQLFAFLALRTGAGALFFFIFRYGFKVLSQIFARTYQLMTDIRNIEGKLIIARAVAETALKADQYSPDERRNFGAALAFAVMKNHFLNMSHESIVDDLEVDEKAVEASLKRSAKDKALNVPQLTADSEQPETTH